MKKKKKKKDFPKEIRINMYYLLRLSETFDFAIKNAK